MKNKLNKKSKIAIIIITLILIAGVVFAVVYTTSSSQKKADKDIETQISKIILDENKGKYLEGEYSAESHRTYQSKLNSNLDVYYVVYLYQEYNYTNGKTESVSGGCSPAVIKFLRDSNNNICSYEFTKASDGKDYDSSLKKLFPEDIDLDGVNTQTLEKECDDKAQAHFNK